MSKLDSYNGTIDLISGLRAKNNGDFPLMQAHDVQATETQRLDEMFKNPESWLPVYNGENEGGAEGGGTGETFKTRLTTVFSEEPASLTTEDMTAFQGAIHNITPVTQIIFNVQGEDGVDYVGFLQNSYVDLEANTLNLVYKTPTIKLNLTANLNTGTMTGYYEINEEPVNGNYIVTLQGESGTIGVEQLDAIKTNFPNVIIEYHEGDPMDNPPFYLHLVSNAFGYTFASLPPIPPAVAPNAQITYVLFSENGSGATWQAFKQPFPTSSGGLTKTKVTLAELVSIAENPDNIGALAVIVPVNVPTNVQQSMLYSGLGALVAPILTLGATGIISASQTAVYISNLTSTITQSILIVSQGGNITSEYVVRVIDNSSSSSTSSELARVEVNDTNFYFYIYK